MPSQIIVIYTRNYNCKGLQQQRVGTARMNSLKIGLIKFIVLFKKCRLGPRSHPGYISGLV